MKKNKGFTLLELLVVIGIIGMLVGIAAVSYSAAQSRTRDARRRADLNSLKDALEQYYSANSFQYPGDCKTGVTTYLNSAYPVDPGTYSYTTSGCSTSAYCICAQMEIAGTGNSGLACAFAAGGNYYCVKNLQ